MKTSPRRPKNSLILETYQELEEYLRAFAEATLSFLILIGSPGLQKSRAAKAALGDRAYWIEGRATPFGVYLQLWQHRDEPVVIDDADELHCDPQGIRLLRALCQTEEEKVISWNSASSLLRNEKVPTQFRTKSRVIIIANSWRSVEKNLDALSDRGIVLLFRPSPLEVHLKTAEWFWDEEIFTFLSERLHLLHRLSMRTYRHAWELKSSGLDWKRYILEGLFSNRRTSLVAKLLGDSSLPTMEEKARKFQELNGGSRATFFNWSRKLRCAHPPVNILPRGLPPDPREHNSLLLNPLGTQPEHPTDS